MIEQIIKDIESREIMFRVWDKVGESIIYPLRQYDEHDYQISFDGRFYVHGHWFADAVIMQYTGVKDKNGKEMYEGDIVKLAFNGSDDMEIGIVIIDQNGFHVVDQQKEYVCENYGEKYYLLEDATIIGNIFENPELIKEKE